MEMTPIKSSALKAVGYDPNSRTMRVELHNGRVYDYADVGIDKHAAMMGNQSPGTYWNAKIKGVHAATQFHPPKVER